MKFWRNPNFVAIFFLVIFSTFALKDLTKQGFYTSHDGGTHTARIAQYYIALKDGQLPPRWAKTLNGGLGSPIFVYIYPIPYLLGSIIHLLGATFSSSFKIIMAASFIFSAIFSYLWFKEVFASSKAAFVGSMFYVWAPYRFSLIYVRGSLSEILVYTFLPLLFLTLTKLSKKINFVRIAACALAFAAVLLSQNLIAYIVSWVIVFYSVILAVNSKSIKLLVAAAASALWGFLIASFTYLPVLFERKLIHFDESFKLVYKSHFTTLGQLLHSPWDYGFDLPGVLNDQMSLQIGLAHILTIFIALTVMSLFFLRKNKNLSNIINQLILTSNKLEFTLTMFFFLTLIIAVILMLDTKATIFFWHYFKPLQFIDLPWRFLGVIVLATAFLAAFVTKIFKNRILVLLLIAAIIIANRNHLRINQSVYFNDEHFLQYQGSATQLNEFRPKTRRSNIVPENFVSPIESIKGKIRIYDFIQRSNLISFKTQNELPARIQVNLLEFKGWQVFMDDQQFLNDHSLVDKSFDFTYRPDIDTSGLYDLIVPAGSHHFILKYQETLLRRMANIISIVSLTLALIVIVKRRHA